MGIMAYLHDLLLVELALLGQVVQLVHVLNEHRSQAVIGQSCAGWILERISECGDDVRRVCRGAVSSHGKRKETFDELSHTSPQRTGPGGKQRRDNQLDIQQQKCGKNKY